MVFIVLEKACDSAPRETICNTLEAKRVSRSYIWAIRDMYCWYTTCILTVIGDIEAFLVEIRLQ